MTVSGELRARERDSRWGPSLEQARLRELVAGPGAARVRHSAWFGTVALSVRSTRTDPVGAEEVIHVMRLGHIHGSAPRVGHGIGHVGGVTWRMGQA